jgi:hypothetical protein
MYNKMMEFKLKKILLVGLLLFAAEAFSNIDSLKKVLATKDFKEVQRYVRDYRKTSNQYSADTYSENKDDSYFCISFQLQTLDIFDSIQNAKIHLINVKLICKNLDIFYYNISDYETYKLNKEFIVNRVIHQIDYLDTIAFNTFAQKHIMEQTSLNEKINGLFPGKFTYGDACGYTGKTPDPRLWMEFYIEKKDSTALFSWLISPHLELKTYAIEGLYKLEKSGMPISDIQWQAIQYIKNSNSPVRTCGGCIYYQASLKELCKGYRFKKRKKK